MSKKNTTTKTAKTEKAVNAEALAKQEERAKIEDALRVLQEASNGVVMQAGSQAGKILASLEETLASIAKEVKETDDTAPLWELDLVPVSVTLGKVKRQWIEVLGLDKNARVQLVEDDKAVAIMIAPKKARSQEAQAYFDALVEAGKDLTKAVALRKAVAGKSWYNVWKVAVAQEQKRVEKKYANLVPAFPEKKN